ncbi:MAG TPA: hypothetical protein VND93_21120, partial [Myxococcales bacterium]|nr:hypothetical protein [Myxococcales bacterium]
VLAKLDEEKWPDVARLAPPVLEDPAVSRIIAPRIRTRLEKAKRQAEWEAGLIGGVVSSAREPAGTLARLAGTFLAALAVVSIVRRTSRNRLKYEIALFDHAKGLTAPDEPLKARLLDELRLLSLEPSVTAERAAELGTVAVIHSPGPDDELQRIASLIDPSAVVGIGLLRVPLGAIWQWLVRFFFPPTFVWRGDLSRYAGETRLELEVRDQRAGASKSRTHRVRVPGVDEAAVVAAVRQLAYRVVHADLKKPATASPEAFAAYQEAHALLARAGEGATREALEDAREELERAIAEDPGYLAARLRLASVVGRLGELDLAAAMVEELGRSAGANHGPELRYEEARIYAQFQDYGRVRRALRLVDDLLATKDLPLAVELNARSLRATIAAALLVMIQRDEADDNGERERLEGVLKAELSYFAGAPPEKMDRRAFALAGALARAARGTYLVEIDARQALVMFRSVLIDHPDLLAAQLGLAKAYRKAKPDGWYGQARPCLERAERLAPKSDAVQYEFGSALLDRQPPDVEGAKAHLEKAAQRSPSALYKLGVLIAEEERRPLDGVRHVSRAIQARRRGAPPFWTEKLVRMAIGPELKDPMALSLAELAVRSLLECARDAGKAAQSESDEEKAERLSERRELRRYLLRSADLLASAIADLPPDAISAAQAQVRALAKTLRDVERLAAEDQKAGVLDPRDEKRAAGLGKGVAAIEAKLRPSTSSVA